MFLPLSSLLALRWRLFLLNSTELELISIQVRHLKISSFAKEQGWAAHLLNIFTRQQIFLLGRHLKHSQKLQPSEPLKFQTTCVYFFLGIYPIYILGIYVSTEIARPFSALVSITHCAQDSLNRKFQVLVDLFYPMLNQNQIFLAISLTVSKVKFKI